METKKKYNLTEFSKDVTTGGVGLSVFSIIGICLIPLLLLGGFLYAVIDAVAWFIRGIIEVIAGVKEEIRKDEEMRKKETPNE